MKNLLTDMRISGVLAHITSIPSAYGIGDIGPAGQAFLEFLAQCGQSCWQFLPVNPTNPLFDSSPYMSISAFAGSPLLISPELLLEDGLITSESRDNHPHFSPYTTDYKAVAIYKNRLLQEAFEIFDAHAEPQYAGFLKSHPWLEDYALFMALKEHYQNKGWFDWPKPLATRNKDALNEQKRIHQRRIEYYIFEQFVFYRQWRLLRQKAAGLGILLFGDIPIYIGLDSVDVWTHQDIFMLHKKTLRPTKVSGVPPDYFSETGQRWGNPLYRWDSKDSQIQERLLSWWVDRFSAVFELVDIARIDHFRGFESYWAIPAKNTTAVNGKWLKGPGIEFFNKVRERLGHLNIIAEDLGIITEEVNILRDALGFPGMKVLQFAFDGNPENSFLPYNYTSPNSVVYTGTHDNDTSVGWFLSNQLNDGLRQNIKQLANRHLHDASGIHHDLIYLALSSTSMLSIFPLQDILGFGNDCKMNSPGVPEGNWAWRCASEFLTKEVASSLKARTELFGRTKKPSSFIPKQQA